MAGQNLNGPAHALDLQGVVQPLRPTEVISYPGLFGTPSARLTQPREPDDLIHDMATTTRIPEPAAQLETPRATDRLEGVRGRARDPLDLLDYRTRRHLVTVSEAAPGRYLAFESRSGMRLFGLTEGATTIGRALGAQIRLDNGHVSRRHATLSQAGGRAQLLDNRSLNGTWVNGERVVVAVLRSGDLIEIGPLVARYLEFL